MRKLLPVCRPAVQRRGVIVIPRPGAEFAETATPPKPAWADSPNVHYNRGKQTGTMSLDHFYVDAVCKRMPPGSDPSPPVTELNLSNWARFYLEVKEAHPMPVTEWAEEWFPHSLENPCLDFFAEHHSGALTHWRRPVTLVTLDARTWLTDKLWKARNQAIKKWWTSICPCDRNIDFIKWHANGRPVVEVQARLGYWSWQFRQAGIEGVAYEDFPEIFQRHGARPFTELKEVDPEVDFQRGKHDDKVVFINWPERRIPGLDRWNGDTVIVAGTGAVGGSGDVGEQLIEQRRGWHLIDAMRVLFWPRNLEHMYVFARGEAVERFKERQKQRDEDDRLLRQKTIQSFGDKAGKKQSEADGQSSNSWAHKFQRRFQDDPRPAES
eukprot:Hpha_TRINITY_DN23613_c0_g1::TRINITY_DN23613_c0_g1_i1::g.57593::m.57593